MPRKATKEDFIKNSREIHGNQYDYSKVDYVNNTTKVTIICPKHDEFLQTPKSHAGRDKQGCPECGKLKQGKSRALTTETYIQKAKEVHGDRYDYSKTIYTRGGNKVTIICKEHGEFDQKANNHINNKANCPKCGKRSATKKLTSNKDEFIKKALEIHDNKYDYSKVEYVSSVTKITIICKEHGEFEQIPKDHLQGKGCINCAGKNKSNTNEFIKKALEIHGDRYDYSMVNYVNNNTIVSIICREHGVFEQSPKCHLCREQGCAKCANNVRLNTEEFINRAIAKHGDKYDYSKVEYGNNNEDKVLIICKKHNFEFWQNPNNHLFGQNCPKCSKHFMDRDYFIEKSNIIHDEKYDYSKVIYKHSHTKVTIICPEHGEFYKRPNNHLMGQGCPHCSQSKQYSMKSLKVLNGINPSLRTAWSPKGEKKIGPYKVDGYCKETKTVYEFHGDYWHGNPKLYNPEEINQVTKTSFGYLFRKTVNKEIELRKRGYNYKCIWEYQSDKDMPYYEILWRLKKIETKMECLITLMDEYRDEFEE